MCIFVSFMANLRINFVINSNLNCREENLPYLNEKTPTQANPDFDPGGRYDSTKLENLGVIYDNISDLTGIGTCYSESEACPWDWPHPGIDFCFYNGSKVIAAAPGQVEHIECGNITAIYGEAPFYVIFLGIRFNESITICYEFEPFSQDEADIDHQLALFKVQEGDWVDKGDEIATFLSFEDYSCIHFMVVENSVVICPVEYYSTQTCEELLTKLHENPATADWKLHYHDYYNIPFEPEPAFPNENFVWDVPRWRILAYKMYFQGEGMPAEYKELFKALAPIKYYKITEAPLLTNYNDNYYSVQLQELYYDPFWNLGSDLKHKLRPIEDRPKLHVSIINFTDPVIDADASFSPILLREIPSKENIDLLLNLFIPKNGTKLALDWSAEQLNLTYSRSQIFASQEGTKLEIDLEKNEIFVNDTSSDAYVRLKYDDRGILCSGEIYFNSTAPFHGNDEWMLINTTRIYDDFDPFDGIDWAYDVDDKNTFNLISKDVIHDNEEKGEIKITNISNIFINFTSEDWGWSLKNIPIQIVQANISIPDPPGIVENVIIGSASEYVPQVIWNEIEDYLYIGDNMLPHFLLNPKEFNGKYMGLLRELKTEDYIVEYGTNWYKLLDSSTGNYSIIKYFADGTLQYIYSADQKMILGDTSDKPLFLYPEEIPVNITEITNELEVNEIEFGATGADDINIALNISVSANKTLIYSGFTKQSVQTSIDNVLFYVDLWLNDTINLNLPINITIKYNDINPWWLKGLNLWWFNESGNNRKGKWELVYDCIDLGYGKLKGSVDRTGVFAITLNPDPEIIWDFNIGDIIGWRAELYINDTLFNYSNQIFNISALTYDIIDDFTRFYVVKLAQMFFNPDINDIEELTDFSIQNASKINFNDAIMDPGFTWINLFIPNNGTGLALHWCANALNSSYSSIMNTNVLTFKIKENEILYTETSSNSYVNLKYYENGTLETGELFLEGMWNPEIGTFDATLNYTRIFDFNPLDDLEWTVDIGDVFYIGESFIGSSGDDIELIKQKIEIVDFINTTISLEMPFEIFQGIITIQEVRANTSFWDNSSKKWMQLAENITISSANELYPIYKEGDMIPVLVPIGTTGAEFAMLSRMTMFSTHEIKVSCGDYSIKILNSTNNGYLSIEFFPDGLIKYVHSEKFMPYGDCVIYYLNNKTINGRFDFEIEPYGTNDFDVSVNISVSQDTLLLFASFRQNPTKNALSNDLLFIDIFLNDTDHLNPPVNITIEYDHDKYKDYKITILWYNRSANDGNGAWEIVEFTDLGNGKIFISVNHASIFALIGTEKEPEPPDGGDEDDGGDDKKPAQRLSFVTIVIIAASITSLMGIIGIVILIIKKKRI